MDGRDADALRGALDITVMVGDPTDLDHPEECPRCGYDAVLALPTHLVTPWGVTQMAPARACFRCFQENPDDLEGCLVYDPRPCPECGQGKHPNCTGETLSESDDLVPCPCAEAGHPA